MVEKIKEICYNKLMDNKAQIQPQTNEQMEINHETNEKVMVQPQTSEQTLIQPQIDNQTTLQPQTSQNDNLPLSNRDEKRKNYERLERARKLIIAAFTIFVIVFVIMGFAMISDLNCKCDYDVCFCGTTTLGFGFLALVPALISTILAAIGMSSLKKLSEQGVYALESSKVLGMISLLQIPIFIVMIAVTFTSMG